MCVLVFCIAEWSCHGYSYTCKTVMHTNIANPQMKQSLSVKAHFFWYNCLQQGLFLAQLCQSQIAPLHKPGTRQVTSTLQTAVGITKCYLEGLVKCSESTIYYPKALQHYLVIHYCGMKFIVHSSQPHCTALFQGEACSSLFSSVCMKSSLRLVCTCSSPFCKLAWMMLEAVPLTKR